MTAESLLEQIIIQELTPTCLLVRGHYYVENLPKDCNHYDGIPLPQSLNKAVGKRKAEFFAGRLCSRMGLTQFNCTAIPSYGDDRAPQWPKGFIGSISHSHGLVAALVAKQPDWLNVGLDYEHWMSAKTAHTIATEILTPAELAHFKQLPEEQAIRYATEIFSVKESLFKTLNPITGVRFYFQDADVIAEKKIRLLKSLNDQWPAGTELTYEVVNEQLGVLTYFLIPRWLLR